jgi:signal peptidase II
MLAITALFAAAVFATSADQASKALAGLPRADRRIRRAGRRSGLRWVLNHRASLVAMPLSWVVLIWIAVLAAAVLAVVQASPLLGIGGTVGLGLALGGATSNLADRVLRGGVVDFIAIGAWPTFNLADAAMLTGTALLAWSLV